MISLLDDPDVAPPTPTPTPTPEPPDAPTVLHFDGDSFSFNWQKGYSATALDWFYGDTDDVTGWRVEYKVDTEWLHYGDTTDIDDTFDVAFLSPDTYYEFRVRAMDGDLISGPSNVVGRTTSALPVPGIPASTSKTATEVSLEWAVPEYTYDLHNGQGPQSWEPPRSPDVSRYDVIVVEGTYHWNLQSSAFECRFANPYTVEKTVTTTSALYHCFWFWNLVRAMPLR